MTVKTYYYEDDNKYLHIREFENNYVEVHGVLLKGFSSFKDNLPKLQMPITINKLHSCVATMLWHKAHIGCQGVTCEISVAGDTVILYANIGRTLQATASFYVCGIKL